MALTKTKRSAKTINPRTLLLFGPPKVGKTTVLTNLPKCMVIDTEEGSHLLEGYFQEVNSKEELMEFYKSAEEGHDYKYFALDTIDKIVEWSEKAVCKEFLVESIADLPYGKGFGEVRTRVMNNVKKLLTLAPHVIIVGHRKIDQLMVSFKGGQALEAGSRCEHLKGKIMPFDWKKIYIKEKGDK